MDGYAEDFPGPGAPTLSSGARSLSFENRQRVVNAGIFAENLIDFRDRYFLTTGIRLDGNSAFGSNFGLQAYPKVSLSYVISEEPFWRANWGDWKLRAAYGQAGRAPGAFDAVRTWSPGSWLQASSFTPNTVGNPNLGPERTTEFELGLDASLFDGRVMAEFTAYNQRTTDALLPVTQVPSIGFGGSQLENVGILTNRGVELGVDATLYERGGLSWDGGMSVTTNHSEMVDLGDSAPFSLARLGFVFEGHPVPAVVGARVLNADELADPQIETDYVFGPNLPTHIISGRTSFGYRGLTLSARGEYQGGHYMDNRASFNLAARDAHPLCQILQAQPREQMNALQRARCDNPTLWELWIYPADFFRLRDVTLQAPVPFAIPGASSAVVTLSARNAWTWRNSGFWDFDPEMIGNDGMDEPVRNIREHIPSPASFTASVRVVF